MEHSWIPSGLYDEHCVHKFPCVGSGWAGVHLNTTGQSRSTSPLVPDLWIAGCWLADGDVTDDRDPWCWICVDATQNLSGWLWNSRIAQCRQDVDVSAITATHEEADTRIILHVINVDADTLIVSVKYTDLLLLLLSLDDQHLKSTTSCYVVLEKDNLLIKRENCWEEVVGCTMWVILYVRPMRHNCYCLEN